MKNLTIVTFILIALNNAAFIFGMENPQCAPLENVKKIQKLDDLDIEQEIKGLERAIQDVENKFNEIPSLELYNELEALNERLETLTTLNEVFD